MSTASTPQTAVVIPNWNGVEDLPSCLDSLLSQTCELEIIVVENGSTDGSPELVRERYPSVTLLPQVKNLGFDGGVNVGIKHALKAGFQFIALFNNDAVADKHWLQNLIGEIEKDTNIGITTGKLLNQDEEYIDSTGDLYTSWGLPYPRGRGEPISEEYDDAVDIFGASGGASLYRSTLFNKIGIFDEDFFAYYEDVDISFRTQLAGWKVRYVPQAIAYHKIGQTSGKIKGFTTYQTIKNLPWVLWKNVPLQLFPVVLPRFTLAYLSFIFSALSRGQFVPVAKGLFMSILFLPKKTYERYRIQKQRTVSIGYIKSMLVWDLPPNATKLRALRKRWWRLKG